MHDSTGSDLEPVLHRKHKAHRDYRRCDEQWLVIVAGQVPQIVLPEEPPKLLIPSMASTFSGINVQDPVSSDFDRVYFFRSPADVTRLTA